MTTPISVLLVEDHPGAGSPLAGAIEEEGHSVICSRSGLDALQKLELARPRIDLIITDHEIPGAFDGLAFVRHARDKGIQTPIIVTADQFTSELILGYESFSILGLLPKPFDLRLLRSLLLSVALSPTRRQPAPAPARSDPWRTVAR